VAEALHDLQVLPIGRTLPEAERTADVYYRAVRYCTPQAVRAAARHIAANDEWYPIPARLREVAKHYDRSKERPRHAAYAGEPGVVCRYCGAKPRLAVFRSVRKGGSPEDSQRFAVQCDPAKHEKGDFLHQPPHGFVRWVDDPSPDPSTLDLLPDA